MNSLRHVNEYHDIHNSVDKCADLAAFIDCSDLDKSSDLDHPVDKYINVGNNSHNR